MSKSRPITTEEAAKIGSQRQAEKLLQEHPYIVEAFREGQHKAREEALEEAAEVADYVQHNGSYIGQHYAGEIADKIRALKDTEEADEH